MTFAELAERIFSGITPLSKGDAYVEPPLGVRFLRSGEITAGGGVTETSEVHISPEVHNGMMRRSQLEKGDLLIAIVGATIGSVGIYDRDDPANINQAIAAVRLKNGTIRREFAYWYLQSNLGQQLLDYFKRPVARANINLEEIGEIPLCIPDDDRQCELIATMEVAREDRRRKLAEADELLTSLDDILLKTLEIALPPGDNRRAFAIRQKDCIVDERIDPGYQHPRYAQILKAFRASPFEKLTLGTISPDIVGGATPTKGNTDFYAADGIKFFRILNIKANEFDLSDLNYIKEEVHQGELKRSQLEENDVLMTITGRVGNAAVVSADLLPANINQHIVRLRLIANDVRPHYLAAYLNSSVGLALSNRGVSGGTRIALDYGAIRAIQIPIPPISLQDSIVTEVFRRRDEARRLRAKADTRWQAARNWFEEQLLGDGGI